MRTLTLVRHAKSSWTAGVIDDFERPLNERGRRDAPETAARFARACPVPDRVISSPAVRALETARAFADALGLDAGRLVTDPRIYEATRGQLLEVLREQPDAATDLLLVGHAPGIADLALTLCGAPRGKFPTTAVLRMHLPGGSWGTLSGGEGELQLFHTPKQPTLPPA